MSTFNRYIFQGGSLSIPIHTAKDRLLLTRPQHPTSKTLLVLVSTSSTQVLGWGKWSAELDRPDKRQRPGQLEEGDRQWRPR